MQEAGENKEVNPAVDPFVLFKGEPEQQVAEQPEPEQTQEEAPEPEAQQEELVFDDNVQEAEQSSEPTSEETKEEVVAEEDDFAWLDSGEEGSQEGEQLETAVDTDTFLEEFGKAINADVFDDQKAIIERAKSIAEENATLKEKLENGESPFANELFEKANEIAKNGGDYLNFLGIATINYDDFSNDVLLDEFVAKAHFPGDTQDAIDKREEYLSDMTETQKQVEAGKIRAQLKAEQEAQMKEAGELSQRQQAEQQKLVEQVNRDLQNQYKKVDKVFGMKLENADKKRQYKSLTDGTLNQSMYHNEKGEFDPQRAVENAWLLERDSKGELVNVKNLVKTYISRSKNEGKAEMLKEASNVEISRSPKKVEVNTTEASGMDKYMQLLKQGKA